MIALGLFLALPIYADHHFVESEDALQNSDHRSLSLAIFPRRNANTTHQLFSPLVDYLSKELQRPVKLVLFKDFANFWSGIEQHRFDIVHCNQYHYLISHKKYGYDVIVRNEEFGESTIAGSIVIRKDSGIKQIRDLRGKKIVFGGGPRAMQSYISVRWLLEREGLYPGEYLTDFAKNPPNSIFSTYAGQSDAAGTGDKVLQMHMVKKAIDINQLDYLARDIQRPHLPWAIKNEMVEELKVKIRDTLINLKEHKVGQELLKHAQLTGLIPTLDSDYDGHRRIVSDVLGEEY